MKNVVFLAAAIFSFAVFMISCGGSEDLKSSDIVGIWRIAGNSSLTNTCDWNYDWERDDDETDYWYFVSAGSNVMTVYSCCTYDDNDSRTCDVTCRNVELIGSFELKDGRLSFGTYDDKDQVVDSVDCYFKTLGESYIEFESEEKAKNITEDAYQSQGSECSEISDSEISESGRTLNQCLKRWERLMTKM